MYTTPAFSIGNSKRSNDIEPENVKFPGPGAYHPVKSHPIVPRFKVGKSKRYLFQIKPAPGPTDYSPKSPSTQSPKWIFGLKHKDPPNANPGPGNYESKAVLRTEPAFSFGVKTQHNSLFPAPKFERRTRSPGPGHYDPNADNSENFTYTFKTSDYEKVLYGKLGRLPGPGQYEVIKNRKESPEYSIGTSQRKNDLEHFKINDNGFPGPAAYTRDLVKPPQTNNTPLMRSRLPDLLEKSKEQLPGVGAYDVSKSKPVKSLPIKFAREARSASPMGVINRNPGPGTYFPTLLAKSDSPTCKIGTSKRESSKSHSPGPGEYNTPSKAIEGPKPSMSGKARTNPFHPKTNEPGPGSFDPRLDLVRERSKSPLIGSSQRELPDSRRNYPGIGEYNLRKDKSDGPAFQVGKERRGKREDEKKDWPGPGNYEIEGCIGKVHLMLFPRKISLERGLKS